LDGRSDDEEAPLPPEVESIAANALIASKPA